ncbi:MAG: hypothetical protein KGI92_06100 [Alphaproteobacteria bacterium]|nr:hypothetical protein [Alphaproteobacteria bacterium]MDE1968461.1 hypothetical protein [Alphaproteobacteria bacterium]
MNRLFNRAGDGLRDPAAYHALRYELLVCNHGGVLDGMPANASMHSGCVAERDLITGL